MAWEATWEYAPWGAAAGRGRARPLSLTKNSGNRLKKTGKSSMMAVGTRISTSLCSVNAKRFPSIPEDSSGTLPLGSTILHEGDVAA